MDKNMPQAEAKTADVTPIGDSVIGKALVVLSAFRDASSGMGAREVARQTGLPKSTVHRLLTQLVEVGFLERQGATYRVGLRLFEIGNYAAFCEPGGMRDTALPFLSALYVQGRDCVVTFAVRSEDRLLVVEKIRGHASPRTESRVGWTLSFTTALGKAILAHSEPELVRTVAEQGLAPRTPYSISRVDRLLADLEAIRVKGYAVDNQESLVGLSGMAAPVFVKGEIVGSVALTERTSTFRLERAAQLVPATAAQLSRALEIGSRRQIYVPLDALN